MVWERIPSSSLASFALYLSASVSSFFSHPLFPTGLVVASLAVPMETALSLEGDVKCLSYESAFMG